MRIEHLRSFVAVYETSSFTAAAERLYTSQPAVTRHVSQLEEELGFPLFNRTTRNVMPTRFADLFYGKVREAIALIDKGAMECRELRESKQIVTVGCEYLYMDHHVAAWLEEFESMHEGLVSFNVVEQHAPQLFGSLSEGSIDCVFIGLTKEDIIPAYLEKRCITSMGETIYVGKNHPLAKRESVTIDDLLDEDFVYPSSRPTSRESLVARDFEEAGRTQRSKVILHQPSALKMVELGSAVIDFPTEYDIASPGLVRVPYRSKYQIRYYFIWNKNNCDRGFELFKAFVEDMIETSGP